MIVVGYTADKWGRAALEHGIAEAKLRQTHMLVINATKGESLADPRFATGSEVDEMEDILQDCGVEFEISQPVGVDPVDELLAAMEPDDAQLLVVGIRHRNPVGKLLLGSVSQKVLLECPKPVLGVKPNES